jgi:hypothetical protein
LIRDAASSSVICLATASGLPMSISHSVDVHI